MKKLITLSIVFILFLSCNNQNEEGKNEKHDTNTVFEKNDKILNEKIITDKDEENETENSDEIVVEELETVVEFNDESVLGIWICNSHQAFELFDDYRFDAHYSPEKGTWEINDNKLFINLDNDTVKFTISKITTHKMIIDKIDCKKNQHFICFTEIGGDKIYSELYRDRPVKGNKKEAFIGEWESGGEIYKFGSDGSYEFHGQDGGTGYWNYVDGKLIINLDDGGKIESDNFLLTSERFAFYKSMPFYRVYEDGDLIQSPLTD